MRSRWHSQDGSGAYQAIVAICVCIVILGTMVFASRTVSMGGELQAAMSDAVRAASLEATPGAAQATGNAVLAASLAEANIQCDNTPTINWVSMPTETVASTGRTELRRGSYVHGRVSCLVTQSDISGQTGSPRFFTARSNADRTLTASSRERVDVFRGGSR